MVKRKAGTLLPFEVVILRAVKAEPCHAYGLTLLLDAPYASTGQALRRLERMEYLHSRTAAAEAQGRYRPPRKVYRLTAKGRRALRDAALASESADAGTV